MKNRQLYWCLFIVLIAPIVNAQVFKSTLSGKIVDAETQEKLPYTNIFFANTTIGTTSNLDGSFVITNIPTGSYQLIVNRVGYKLISREVIFQSGSSLQLDFTLEQQPINAGEMQVLAAEPKEWKEQLKQFRDRFLGETTNARKCHILNPEVLRFQIADKTNELIAYSDSTVRIENLALGYRLLIVFDKFQWGEQGGLYSVFPKFEELIYKNLQQQKQWEKNRRETYLGSFQHFISALAHVRAVDDGFQIYLKNGQELMAGSPGTRVGEDRVVFDLVDKSSPMKKFQFPDYLEVVYLGRTPSSYLKLVQGFVFIDPTGYIYPPLAMVRYGAWAKSRIADTLPLDYETEK